MADQDFATRLRQLGYRLTPQRQLILESLREIGGHATVGHVYAHIHEKSPAIDRATVYRTVHLFEKIGMVVSAEISGQTVYEITESEPHHHLVCRNCKSVTMLDDHHFHDLAHHLQDEHGFKADISHMTIYGTCGDCAAAAS